MKAKLIRWHRFNSHFSTTRLPQILKAGGESPSSILLNITDRTRQGSPPLKIQAKQNPKLAHLMADPNAGADFALNDPGAREAP